jgi:hypothetical protein
VTRLVVLGVAVLAALAVADGLRGTGGPASGDPERPGRQVGVIDSPPRDFVAVGRRLENRVLRNGREYLSAAAIRAAFPVDVPGPIVISRMAVARDGTLALALYRFPSATPAQGALEFWRDRKPVGGFGVPPGYFGGGVAFNHDGTLVATFSYDGQLRGVFDRSGRRVDGLPGSFLAVD